MKYGKTVSGSRWHMLVDGRALCIARHMPSTVVQIRDRSEVPDEDICDLCDAVLRDKGKAARERMRPNPAFRKTIYNPRYKFEDL